MGYKDREWAVQQRTSHPIDTIVLVAIADRHNAKRGGCWPHVKTIATEAHCSERTVRYALKRLEAAGLIERIVQMHAKRGQQANLYRIVKNGNERSSAILTVPLQPPPADFAGPYKKNLSKEEPKGPSQGEYQPIKVEYTREATAPVALGTAVGFGLLARFLARPTARIQGGRRHG
jgi:DNA-binding transcriptional MocR family regulator